MEIIYPPLVEQSFNYYSQLLDEPIAKNELYRSMVENEVITETGLPTQKALQQGLVKDFYEAENLSFAEFLSLYSIFESRDPADFQLIDGFWEVPLAVKVELENRLKTGELPYDFALQLAAYLEDR